MTLSSFSIAVRKTRWGVTSAVDIPVVAALGIESVPLNRVTLATLSGLSNSIDASTSPALIAAPSFTRQLSIPDSSTLSGMNIFITSISQYGSPFLT